MLQSTVVLRRALARASRPASPAAAAASLVAGASPCCPHRRLLSSSGSSSPPPKPQQEPPAAAGGAAADAGKQPAGEPVSEKEAARLKKIAKIKEEIRRGYFYELGEMNRTKGKVCTWEGRGRVVGIPVL